MDSQRVTTELAKLLGDPERDFSKEPITNSEGHDLMLVLFELVADPNTPEELSVFYLQAYEIVKQHVLLS
jgi:hypothetical protein